MNSPYNRIFMFKLLTDTHTNTLTVAREFRLGTAVQLSFTLAMAKVENDWIRIGDGIGGLPPRLLLS